MPGDVDLTTKHLLISCVIGFRLSRTIGCSDIPEDISRPSSNALQDGHYTTLGRTFGKGGSKETHKIGILETYSFFKKENPFGSDNQILNNNRIKIFGFANQI
ncbi:MAG: hypothetical protein JRE65_14490 [Deltaproteobacteria bacterium]|jgi:hypothetical protein|nr:hypothetical protein [Deltaproteobacteria bacterium]